MCGALWGASLPRGAQCTSRPPGEAHQRWRTPSGRRRRLSTPAENGPMWEARSGRPTRCPPSRHRSACSRPSSGSGGPSHPGRRMAMALAPRPRRQRAARQPDHGSGQPHGHRTLHTPSTRRPGARSGCVAGLCDDRVCRAAVQRHRGEGIARAGAVAAVVDGVRRAAVQRRESDQCSSCRRAFSNTSVAATRWTVTPPSDDAASPVPVRVVLPDDPALGWIALPSLGWRVSVKRGRASTASGSGWPTAWRRWRRTPRTAAN